MVQPMKLDHNLYEFLFESATEGMILLRDGQCVHTNNSALKLLGLQRTDLLGMLFTEVAPIYQPNGERSAKIFSEREETALDGQAQTFEFVLQTSHEEPVYVRINLTAVDVEGIPFLRVSLRDIKQERIQAQALADAESSRLERRRRQVQLATQVNQTIAIATSLDDLYHRVVVQVKEQFHYYHVQLLRFDTSLEAAVLVAGYGNIGEQMMAQEHQMQLGVGLIGLAAQTGTSILRSDISHDVDWRSNPLLPDTEGELAVPIKLGNKVLGVLDVQSDAAGLLDADDQLIMEEVCGQVAIALENTRLRQDMEDRLRELGTLQQLTTLDGWREYSVQKRREIMGYQFQQGAYYPLTQEDPLMTDVVDGDDGTTIIQPMDAHGYRIGELGIFDDPENPLSFEEETLLSDISTQVAEAMERARLFEQTHQQAAELQASLFETETLYRASRYIGAATNTEEIVLGAAQIGVSLGMSLCTVMLFAGTGRADTPTRGDIYTIEIEKNSLNLAPIMQNVELWDAEVVQKISESSASVQVYRDAANEEEPIPVAMRGYLRGLNLRGGVLLGLQSRTRPLGILSYFSPKQLTTLPENHVRQMRTIADQLVITFENHNLLTDAQARARREQLSREIGTKLSGSVDVDTILKTAARELSLALNTSHAIIRLGKPESEAQEDNGDTFHLPNIWQSLVENAEPYLFRRSGNTFTSARNIWRQEMREAVVRRIPVKSTTSATARIKSAVAIPIQLRGQMLGVLDLYDEQVAHQWSDDDIVLMLNVADQTALSLDNARLLTESQQALANVAEQARRPALLNEMSQELSRLDDERNIFNASVRHIKDILRADTAQLYLLNEATNRLELVAFTQPGLMNTAAAIPVSNTLMWSVVLQNRQRFSPGTRQLHGMHVAVLSQIDEATTWYDVQALRQEGINSVMIAPLSTGAQVVGVMTVGAEKKGSYTTDDENFFIQVASLISATIENRRLFKQTQQSLAKTEQLYDVSQSLNAASSLQDILSVVVSAFPVTDINRVLLMTVNRDLLIRNETLSVIANWYSGRGAEPVPIGKKFSHSMDASLETLVTSEPNFIADVRNNSTLDAPSLQWFKETNTRAAAVFPLAVGHRYLGVLLLQSDVPHPFNDTETQPYTSIISQVATTVENQRLLEETRAALEAVEATQRRYTLQAWNAYYATHIQQSYEKIKDPEISVPPLPESDIMAAVQQKSPVIHTKTENGVPSANLVVPVTWRDEVTGVVGIQEETGQKRHWLPEEIALLEAIASEFAQVADALRLLDDTQRRAAREARINTISEKIQSAQTLEDALRIAVKEVGLSLNAPQTSVKLAVKAED